MREERTLTWRWQFVGAEKYNGSDWQTSENYVPDMIWTFEPQYFGENKIIGNITETTPSGDPIIMAYAYDKRTTLLKIDISTECSSGEEDGSQADICDVIYADDEQSIKLNILTHPNYPQQYFRYTLQKID